MAKDPPQSETSNEGRRRIVSHDYKAKVVRPQATFSKDQVGTYAWCTCGEWWIQGERLEENEFLVEFFRHLEETP